MNELVQPNTRYKAIVAFLFYFLLFSYPWLSFIWRRSYPFFTSEVAVVFTVFAAFCVLLAVVVSSARSAIANVLTALLVTFLFMIQFDFLLFGLVFCITVCLLLAWWLKGDFLIFGLPVIATLIIGAYFDSFEDDGRKYNSSEPPILQNELRPVVHILLDGFAGIEGLPPHPESAAIKSEVFAFLSENNFLTFPKAYSRYSRTGESLYSAMNFKHDGKSEFGLEALSRRQHVLRTNAEFSAFEELGYRLNVYQTGHLDFCQSNPDMLDRCWEYTHPNVASINQANGVLWRIKMLLGVLLRQSKMMSGYLVSRGWLSDHGIAVHDPRVFENLTADVTQGGNGEVYFAHVLLPHGPFVYNSNCVIDYQAPLWARYGAGKNERVQSEYVYEKRFTEYYKQIRCALYSLNNFFEDMKAVGVFDRAIIVVHGDHGSSIGRYRPVSKNIRMMNSAEYRSHYSTLFAVKIPGQNGSIDHRVLPLGFLLEAFTELVKRFATNSEFPTGFSQAQSKEPEKIDPYVYLLGSSPLTRVDINIFED